MKRIILPLLLILFSVTGLRAQTLTITNATACDVWFVLSWGTAPCGVPFSGSTLVVVPAGTVTTPMTVTALPGLTNFSAAIADCNGGGVLATVAPTSVSTACPAYSFPNTAVVRLGHPSCNCPVGTVIHASASNGANPNDWSLEFY